MRTSKHGSFGTVAVSTIAGINSTAEGYEAIFYHACEGYQKRHVYNVTATSMRRFYALARKMNDGFPCTDLSTTRDVDTVIADRIIPDRVPWYLKGR